MVMAKLPRTYKLDKVFAVFFLNTVEKIHWNDHLDRIDIDLLVFILSEVYYLDQDLLTSIPRQWGIHTQSTSLSEIPMTSTTGSSRVNFDLKVGKE